jgi:hypothetical protein
MAHTMLVKNSSQASTLARGPDFPPYWDPYQHRPGSTHWDIDAGKKMDRGLSAREGVVWGRGVYPFYQSPEKQGGGQLMPFRAADLNPPPLAHFRRLGVLVSYDHCLSCQIALALATTMSVSPMTAKGARLGSLVLGIQPAAVWITAVTIIPRDADSHFAEGVNPLGNGMHGKLQQGIR